MSIPQIPGYTSDNRSERTLGAEWKRPDGTYPAALWPQTTLDAIDSQPTGWLVVDEHFYSAESHGGTGCVLVTPDQTVQALRKTTWVGRSLGEVGVWDSGKFEDGLREDGPPFAEFFAQARRASGAKIPQIDISPPFLWFWDAYASGDGWRYVNRAGREQELVRFTRTEDAWRIEVRALEFRTYLAMAGRSAIVQKDIVTKMDHSKFPRVDAKHVSEWAHFDFYALYRPSIGAHPAFSGLMGQFVVSGQRTARLPRWEERRKDREYPEFVYGVDPTTGEWLKHTCNPDELGTYFDEDNSRLHYLTPVYFRRDVLQPYTAEPGRYDLSSGRLSCLNLWGLDISFNSVSLVEVYLGDLGRDLPSEEWGHWLAYNVPPEGVMDEGRFRRDFLNQFASSTDPVGVLRRLRERVNNAARNRYGQELWGTLPENLNREYQSLVGPLSDDAAALNGPLLVLTKTLVDALNSKLLKKEVDGEKGEQSLRLLQKLLNDAGDNNDASKALRDLQALRSRGGIAHLENSESAKAAAAIGIAGLGASDAFAAIIAHLTASLTAIAVVLEVP